MNFNIFLLIFKVVLMKVLSCFVFENYFSRDIGSNLKKKWGDVFEREKGEPWERFGEVKEKGELMN